MTGAINSTSGTIGGWTIGTNTLYSGSGSNLIALNNSNPGTSGQPVIYAGGEGGNAPFYVTRSGELHATSATIKGHLTVDSISFSSGVTMNASNLTDLSIQTEKIAGGAVSYGKASQGVKTSLDNGDSAYAAVTSLAAGTVTCNLVSTASLRLDRLSIGHNSTSFHDLEWHDASNYITGVNFTNKTVTWGSGHFLGY